MSFTTGTQAELLSANIAVGSALVSSAVATSISPTSGAAYTPSNFWLPTYGVAKSLWINAWGVLGTTGTPNLTLAVTGNITQGTYNSSGILATTGVVAMPSTVTNAPWNLDVIITCSGTGASATFLTFGTFQVYGSTTAMNAYRISSSTANPNTAATLSTEAAYYIELAATWGTSSASNTITCYNYTVMGLN